MKKIYLMMVTVFLAALIPMQAIADTPQLTAANENGEVKVSITNSTVTQNADEILPGIKECVHPVTQSITVKADAGVIASIRLVVSEIQTDKKTTPLNNYTVIIKNDKEEVIYDSTTAVQAKRNDSYKDMLLGELQAGEEKTYSVTYSIIDATVDISTISVELAAKTNVEPTPAPKSTLKPKFDFDSLNKQSEFVFDFSDEKTDNATATTVTEIKKVCGEDIPAGRFSITGNGKLVVTSATGAKKSESVVSETPVAGQSVKTAVVLLEDKDVLTITPLEGQEKARLKFNKVTTENVAGTPTPVKPANDTKTNPKTGDGGIGIVVGVAALAVLAFVALEVLKRKNNN